MDWYRLKSVPIRLISHIFYALLHNDQLKTIAIKHTLIIYYFQEILKGKTNR